jgi:aspartyl-tRNA(Asn)/glutamyl-tRNA(Gln) amidotransferase subunit A
MCLGALGSQTGGSICRPASYCGVAGIKPTYGRVPLEGIVPLAHSMDHPGPMATCVRDLAIMLPPMLAPGENLGADSRFEPGTHLAPAFGRLGGLFKDRAEPVMSELVDRMADKFRESRATVRNVEPPPLFGDVVARHRVVMAVEAASFHEPRLRRHPQDYGPNISKLLEEGIACTAPEYARCKGHQGALRDAMLACFGDVDVLLTPATTSPPPTADTTGDPAFNSPWSYVGFPTVSLPAGWTREGLPICIQLIGKPGSDATLLAVAEWCERVIGFERREPAA